MRTGRVLWFVLGSVVLMGLLLSSCGGASSASEGQSAESVENEDVSEPAGEMEGSGPKDYGVPAKEASVVNPIVADDASLQRGKEVYESSCLKCHGEEGRGDGPSRTNPDDFRADYVKTLSDGESFYIISNGIEGSAMTGFTYLDEDQRWHLVNYIRALQE